MRANNNIWNKVWNMHIDNPKIITSKSLACSGDSAIIIKYIEMLFNNRFKRKKKGFNYYSYIIARHANNKEIFELILRNLKKIRR